MQKIAILYDASQAVLSTFDLDEVLQQILVIAHDYFHLQNAAILLLDEGELHVRRQIGWDEGQDKIRLAVGKGITGVAALQKRPIYAPDVSKDPRYVLSAQNTRSELAIPLMVRDQVVGVLDCQSENVNHFDAETVDLLALFSTQASIALENARLYSLERRRASQLEAINVIAKQMTVSLDQPQLLSKVCWLIQETFQVPQVSALFRDEEELILKASHGTLALGVQAGESLPMRNTPWGRAFETGKYLIEDDITQGQDGRFFPGSASRMSIPLVFYGQALGVLVLTSNRKCAFNPNDAQPLESVADICAAAIQNAIYVERMRKLAYLDGLTGIFNRRYFEDRVGEEIERVRRFGSCMGVIMLDIDQFKRLNDQFGHLLGDEVLRQVASILHQQVRKFDIVCRYGGEEFVVLLSQTNPQHLLQVAEKLVRMVENWQFPGVPRPVTISAGAANYPEHGSTRDELVEAADRALYTAKKSGRNRACLATGPVHAEHTPHQKVPELAPES